MNRATCLQLADGDRPALETVHRIAGLIKGYFAPKEQDRPDTDRIGGYRMIWTTAPGREDSTSDASRRWYIRSGRWRLPVFGERFLEARCVAGAFCPTGVVSRRCRPVGSGHGGLEAAVYPLDRGEPSALPGWACMALVRESRRGGRTWHGIAKAGVCPPLSRPRGRIIPAGPRGRTGEPTSGLPSPRESL